MSAMMTSQDAIGDNEAADTSDLPDWLDRITAVAGALGQETFETQLMALLNRLLPVDHCTVFTFDPKGQAGHLFTSSKMPAAEAETLARDYVGGYYAEDPNYEAMRRIETDPDAPVIALPAQNDEQNYNRAYRERFFERTDLIDKAAAMTRLPEGTVYCSFYRMGGSGKFSDHDRARLNRVLPLVTSLIGAHYRLRQAPIVSDASTKPRETGGAHSLVYTIIQSNTPPFEKLTDREREVCARILLGYTSEAIGLDLDIAPTSVATYRKRAYGKLGIASQNELFSLCLDAVDRLGTVPHA
jgi:DNA-binding CsgD family transcriptional regulator/CheY-like chemotaxis protein